MSNLLTGRQIVELQAAYRAAAQAQRCLAEFLDAHRSIQANRRTLTHFEMIETQTKLTGILADIDTKLGLHDAATKEPSHD